ncbi:MAG: hypothetical protein NTZ55_04395 [Candidatus Roizmanbacteria bacterium]|nr:hypothetical protein [Candidatus Roizmanbacteria bacterium]
MIKSKAKYLLFLFALLPLIGGYIYQDSLYYLIGLCVFAIIYFALKPTLLNKKFHIPQKKKGIKINFKINSFKFDKLFSTSKSHWVIPILVGTIILTIYFTYHSVVSFSDVTEKNIYIKYLISFFKYFSSNSNQFIFPFILSMLGIFYVNKKRITDLKKNIAFSVLLVLLSIVIAVNTSFVGVYVFAIYELNTLSISSKNGIIVSGKDAVSKRLKSYKQAPRIIGKDYKIDNVTIYKALQTNTDRGTYYEEVVINSLPKVFTSLFSLPKDNIVLFGKYLLIRSIDRQEIQAVTGSIVKNLIQDSLSSKYIKNEPNYEVIGRQEYLKYREEQINKDIRKIEGYIEKEASKIDEINKYLNEAYKAIKINNDGIEEAKSKIKINENGISDALSLKGSYSSCINDGYFFYNTFIRTHSQSYCDSLQTTYDGYISQFQKNIRDWNNTISENQKNISDWSKAIEILKTNMADINEGIQALNGYKTLLQARKDGTVYELGIFLPEKEIKLALDDVSSKSLADFLSTAVHEYLHYTSYATEEKSNKFESFFEEALTEYFARKVIKKELNIDTGQGYPLFTRIISEVAKKIGDKELLEIYLTKDQSRLEYVLNKTYGKDFYGNSQTYFIQLYYSSAKNELKVANNLMFRIGGKQIKESELYSTTSELK